MRCLLGWHTWVLRVLDPGSPPWLDWIWQCDRCERVEIP